MENKTEKNEKLRCGRFNLPSLPVEDMAFGDSLVVLSQLHQTNDLLFFPRPKQIGASLLSLFTQNTRTKLIRDQARYMDGQL
jgi:hypothetical protein